jgi:uncharacterized spore protein YtfJ
VSDVEKPEEATPDRAAQVMEKLIAAGDVSRVYGQPIQAGDALIIPAAEVLTIAGFGMGGGSGTASDASGAPRQGRGGGGGGGGGGGRTLARSVAVIVASPAGVEVKPVLDLTKIALAALTAAGFVWGSWKSMEKPRRPGRWFDF